MKDKTPPIRTAYDIIARILGLTKSPIKENIYFLRKNGRRYIQTKWGFEPVEKYNLNIQVLKLERKLERQFDYMEELEYDNAQLLRRKAGLIKQLNKSYDYAKGLKRKIGFLNKLLKEVLDKNVAWEKRLLRLEKNEENIRHQLENLKTSKAALVEQNQHLTEKSRQQKKQIQELQTALNTIKQQEKQPV
jgi:chromosome segregation ATPase